MYHLGEDGKRVYTLAKVDSQGRPTFSAHPGLFIRWLLPNMTLKLTLFPIFVARFSPEDKYARERIMIKKRFGLLITQKLQKHAAN